MYSQNEKATQIEIPKPDPIEISQSSPDQLSKTSSKWGDFYRNHLNGIKGSAINFGATSGAFQLASLFHVLVRMASEPEKEPTMLKNFFTNQVFSTQAQVSLLFMVTGIQMANSQFAKFAERHAWIKNENQISVIMKELAAQKSLPETAEILTNSKGVHPKLLAEWKKVRATAEKIVPGGLTNSQFQKISLMTSFAVIMPVVTMFSDLLSDPDIQYYGESLISSPEEISQMIRKKGYSPYAANQRAYDRWVKGNKILDYTPMLLSAWTTLSIQLFVVPSAAKLLKSGFEKMLTFSSPSKARIIYKGIQFVNIGKSFIPQNRIVTFVGQAISYVALNEILNRTFEKIYTEVFYSSKLNSQIKELINYPIYPNISSDCMKQVSSSSNFKQEIWNSIPYSQAKRILELSDYSNCATMEPSFEEKLDEVASSFRHWRQFWFKASLVTLDSWSDYISKIKADYLGSYFLYHQFVEDSENLNSFLRQLIPFYGVGAVSFTAGADLQLQALVNLYKTIKQSLTTLKTKKEKTDLNSDEIKVYSLFNEMFTYLSVFDGSIPKKLELIFKEINQRSLSENEKKVLINQYTDLYASHAITLFKNQSQKLSTSLVDKSTGSFNTIATLLKNASPKGYGELWFNSFRLNDYLYLNKDTRFKRNQIYGIEINDSIEWYFAHLVCSKSNLETVIQTIPFWTLNFKLPSLLKTSSDFNCSTLNFRNPFDNKVTLNLFNSEFVYENRKYFNLVDFAIQNVRADFKGTNRVRNFENWWNSKISLKLNQQLEAEKKKFFLAVNQNVLPSILNEETYSGIPKGYLPSLQKEIQFYLSIAQRFFPHLNSKMNEINDNLSQMISILSKRVDKKENSMASKLLITQLRSNILNNLVSIADIENQQSLDRNLVIKKLVELIGQKFDEATTVLRINEILYIDGL